MKFEIGEKRPEEEIVQLFLRRDNSYPNIVYLMGKKPGGGEEFLFKFDASCGNVGFTSFGTNGFGRLGLNVQLRSK